MKNNNGFMKHYDGSEGPQNLMLVNSEKECVLFYGHGTDDTGGFRWRKDYDHRPTREEIQADIEALINEQVAERIREGLVYDNIHVWLSKENQLNFRSTPTIPVRFKLGNYADGTTAYKIFETREELESFNGVVADHIARCLNEGWDEKDAVDYSVYENV